MCCSNVVHLVLFGSGDGAGVGKGRTIAGIYLHTFSHSQYMYQFPCSCVGIIYQNYLEGRKKAVW